MSGQRLKNYKRVMMYIGIGSILLIVAILSIMLLNKSKGNIVGIKEPAAKTKLAQLATDVIVGQVVTGGNKAYTDPASGKIAVIPNGFKIVMGLSNINQGLVIEDSIGNQFVWIPVPNIADMYDSANQAGKLWDFASNGATQTMKTFQGWNAGYREPDVVTNNNIGNGTGYDGNSMYYSQLGFSSRAAMKGALQSEFQAMIASVREYKGFYVGRYETGNLSQATVVSKAGNTDIASQMWYTMYKKEKAMYAGNNYVASGMIWGCQWDQMLKVIYASDNTKSLTDSTSWGNYNNATFTYENGGTQTKALSTSTIIPTGSTEYTKAYNTYDVAGNVYDWTMEAYSAYYRVLRGGVCVNDGSSDPASNRYNFYPHLISTYYGSRLQLYIQ